MLPPEYEMTPPAGDIVPYPDEYLILGGGRWLSNTGEVLTKLRRGSECVLTSQTIRFWEGAAVRGGHVLADLMG